MGNLEGENERLRKENKELKTRLDELIRKLALSKKDALTSSKPSSSYTVKQPHEGKAKPEKRKIED